MNDPFPAARAQFENNIADLERRAHLLMNMNRGTIQARNAEDGLNADYAEAMGSRDALTKVCDNIEGNPHRFGIGPDELRNRRAFLERATTRLNVINSQLNGGVQGRADGPAGRRTAEDRRREAGIAANQRRIDDSYAQDQEMLHQQEFGLEQIGEGARRIKQHARDIGTEIDDQMRQGEELGDMMDRSQTRIDNIVFKMKEFLTKKRVWLWTGCIVLTLLLLIMVIWAFMM